MQTQHFDGEEFEKKRLASTSFVQSLQVPRFCLDASTAKIYDRIIHSLPTIGKGALFFILRMICLLTGVCLQGDELQSYSSCTSLPESATATSGVPTDEGVCVTKFFSPFDFLPHHGTSRAKVQGKVKESECDLLLFLLLLLQCLIYLNRLLRTPLKIIPNKLSIKVPFR